MNRILTTRLLASTAAIALIAMTAQAHAQSPQAPTVAAGSIAITRQGGTTVVTQGTDKGIIDWRSFSVGPQEAVRFDQPGRSSVTLNRVTGTELSRIDGAISATGQVWLANPNGVMIGPGGQVNVGGLLATTGRVDAAEFLRTGRAQIDQIGKDAAVVNAGAITIGEGGYAALAAAAVRNDGVVAARSGTVAFGAGKAMTLDFAGDKLIAFQIAAPLDQAPANADALIVNGGTIAAQGGTVLMSARAAKGVMDNVINLKGHVVSNAVRVDGGTVTFGDGGTVQVSAKIDASSAVAVGGEVSVLGEKVGLMDGAAIDASGATGGGTVLIGGDWQGKGQIGSQGQNALVTYVAPTASISVDATQTGDGGKAVIWADDTTRFNGTITARGGVQSGNGGRVETSGKRSLTVAPNASVVASARSAQGRAGDWLLDPNDITITNSSDSNITAGPTFNFTAGGNSVLTVATINAALNGGNNVTIRTSTNGSDGTGGSGDISFTNGTITTSYSGGAVSLSLLADRDIIQSGAATIDLTGAAHSILLAARANGAAIGGHTLQGVIQTTGGSITIGGGSAGTLSTQGSSAAGFNNSGSISSGGGNITIRGGGNNTSPTGFGVQNSGIIDAGGGVLTIIGVSGTSNATAATAVFSNAGTISSTGGGTISITGTSLANATTADGVNLASTTIQAGTGGLTITGTGASVAGTDARGVLLISSPVTSSGPINITGTGGGGSGGQSYGVLLNSSISASGGAALNVTGVRGTSAGSSNIYVSGGSLSTNSGNLTLTGTATAGGASAGNYGVFLTGNAGATTASGTISISGNGALAGAGSDDGINIGVGSVTATGAGSIVLSGGRGSAGYNVAINGKLSTTSGALTISGVNTGGGGVNAGGVLLSQGTITTLGGAIDIQGAAAVAGGSSSHGVQIGSGSGGGTVTATGSTGVINVNGVRGVGNDSYNILVYGPTSQISTVDGSLSLIGNSSVGGGTASYGIALSGGPTLTTTTGAITMSAAGVSSGAAHDGFNFNSGTISATGTGGSIVLSGVAGPGAYALALNNSPISTIDSSIILNIDGLLVIGTSSFSAGTAVTFVRPTAANVSIGLDGGSGTLQLQSNAFYGNLDIGRNDLTAPITVGAGAAINANTFFRTGGGNVSLLGSFDSSANGARSVTFAAGTGNVFVTAGLGNTTPLSSITKLGTGTLSIAGVVNSNGAQNYAGPMVLTGASTFSVAGGSIMFAGAVDGGFSIDASASTISLTGGLGGVTPLSSLSFGGVAVLGGNITTNLSQTYQTANFLNNTTISTSNANVVFNSQNDGPGGVTFITGSGTVMLGANVGQSTPLNHLIAAGTGSVTVFNNVITTGTQSYAGSVLVSGSGTFSTAGGSINFANTVDGGSPNSYSMTLNPGTGTVSFANQVGSTSALTTLNSLGSGFVYIGGNTVTSGTQSYAGAVVLTNSVNLSTNNNDVTITGSLDGLSSGNQTLFVGIGTGTLSLAGGAGGNTALNSLYPPQAAISGLIRTTGVQNFGATRLLGSTTLDSGNGDISLGSTINGAFSLSVASGTGSVTIAGGIGSTTPLNGFAQTGTGTVSVGGIIRTIGGQSYAGSVVLSGAATFSTTGGDLMFSGPVNATTAGVETLSTSVVGTVSLLGGAGALTELSSLTLANPAVLGGLIRTNAGQSYQTANFATNTTLSTNNAAVTFSGTNDGPGGLTLATGTGAVSLGSTVGQTTRLAYLNYLGSVPLTVFNSVHTVGTQSYAGAVIIQGAGAFSTNNNAITFSNPVDAFAAGGQSMTVNAGTAAVSFGNNFGAATPLATFTQLGTGTVTMGGTYVTTGTQSYAGSIVLAGSNVQFSSTNSNLVFTGAVNGASTGNESASFSTPSGSLTLANGIGATTPLATLALGAATVGGTIATTGAQSYAGALTLSANTTFSAPSSQIEFSNHISGPFNLTASANQIYLSKVGGINVSTPGGTQSYGGAVILGSDAVVSGAKAVFGGALDGQGVGAQTLASNATETNFAGVVGGGKSLNNLLVSAGGTAQFGGAVTTSGSQSYGGPVLIAGPTNLTAINGPVTFANTINSTGGAQSLAITVGNGASANFAGGVGLTTPLSSFAVDVANVALTLPSVQATTLTITTAGGDVGQSGPLVVSGTTDISSGAGQVVLNNASNDFNQLNLASSNSVSVVDGVGGLAIVGAGASMLTLSAVGPVSQTGAISAPQLLLLGTGGNFNLGNTSNNIGTLAANTGAVSVVNGSSSALTVGTIGGTGGVTVTSAASLTQTGGQNLTLNGPINSGAGTVALSSNQSILGSGLVTASTLLLTATGNSSTVNTSASTVTVLGGTVSVNGTAMMQSSATVASTPSVASSSTLVTFPTVASVPSFATVPTVATVASVASVPTLATVASFAPTPTIASVASTATLPSLPTLTTLFTLLNPGSSGVDPGAGNALITQILTPPVRFDVGSNASGSSAAGGDPSSSKDKKEQEAAAVAGQPAGGASSSGPTPAQNTQPVNADSARAVVTAAPPGALIPPPPTTAGPGGPPMAAAPTIKLDAADTGGANGQVIATGGAAAAGGGGGTTLVQGLVKQVNPNAPRPGAPTAEPPLSMQPSTVNEEAFF